MIWADGIFSFSDFSGYNAQNAQPTEEGLTVACDHIMSAVGKASMVGVGGRPSAKAYECDCTDRVKLMYRTLYGQHRGSDRQEEALMAFADDELREITAIWSEIKENRSGLTSLTEVVSQLRIQQNAAQQEHRSLQRDIARVQVHFDENLGRLSAAYEKLSDQQANILQAHVATRESTRADRRLSDRVWKDYLPLLIAGAMLLKEVIGAAVK